MAEQHRRAYDIFSSALDKGASQAAFLASACGDDPDLRRDVEKLLAAYKQGGSSQNSPGQGTTDVGAAAPVATPPPVSEPAVPAHIGRYRIEKVLGEGGFGRVYLAHDDQLGRPVAIKVPRPSRLAQPGAAQAYLAEAQIVARLDHPHIVPVFDIGTTADGLCFVVSKLIEGNDLARTLRQTHLDQFQAAELIATVAEALHFAHRQGLVHRDIKPGNILLDTAGKPYVADFGLALREEDFGKASKTAGTPAYMSPEQARGEGHRVDGRSDIFSLGVVFYEMLTGRRPFQGATAVEVLDQIARVEVRPPRQVNDTVAKELERICLQALSKRAADRCTTAKDMAEDLRQFLDGHGMGKHPQLQTVTAVPTANAPAAVEALAPVAAAASDSRPLQIIPKGLRSFDGDDADFFLELLPGARDRNGLPDSIRFWKSRIEKTGPDGNFLVGLLFGPSGCGKSSLVKAGLLPRLALNVVAVYLEATPDGTETRLLNGLRKHLPLLPEHLGIHDTLAALRRGRGLPAGKKVLIVLDQFEQWLHARRSPDNSGLVAALRQCDGEHVQCIVMVRDDFWLAVCRFMNDLEIELVQGRNMALADLFDSRHARKVLAAFGRAFGALPQSSAALSADQEAFLDQVVTGLGQDGKIISVRLALFAEMVKSKPWTPATLSEMGGIAGLGVTFLEEIFASSTAPPPHRLHQRAAQAVLRTLLPASGADFRGQMQSFGKLLHASGYVNRPKDFEALLRILDGELHLITPADPEVLDERDEGEETRRPGYKERRKPDQEQSTAASSVSGSPGLQVSKSRFYQLTHDYLVPSLREWLTRKQKSTRRGRAELRLAERATAWSAHPESRQLPSWWEWATIRVLTRKKAWTTPQRNMMAKATRLHALRSVLLGMVFLAGFLTIAAFYFQNQEFHELHAKQLVQQLLDAKITSVPRIVAEIDPNGKWANSLLREANEKAHNNSPQKLHTSLALLPVDANQVAYLYGRVFGAEPQELGVLRDALQLHKEMLVAKLWSALEQPPKGLDQQRLRAAALLAGFDPESQGWIAVQNQVADDLVAVPEVYLGSWIELLYGVRAKLVPHLAAVFRDAKRPESERSLAADFLASYGADQPKLMADLLLDANEKQFARLLAKYHNNPEIVLAARTEVKKEPLPEDANRAAKDRFSNHMKNAGVVLLKNGLVDEVWPLLKFSSDPRTRSYLIHYFGPLGADPGALARRIDEESDIGIRQALILSLGEFTSKDLVAGNRDAWFGKLKELYKTAADPGLHAAAEWLLRHWSHVGWLGHWSDDGWLDKINEQWANDKAGQDKKLDLIGHELAKDKEQRQRHWFVNGQGQTMIVLPGPTEFWMGSPLEEVGHASGEVLHRHVIGRSFAIAAKLVTVEQYKRFAKNHKQNMEYGPAPGSPVNSIIWFDAAAYCNFLSREEGIPEDQWCYEIVGQGKERDVKLKPNSLQLAGYRLPTEAEAECACRAGTMTSRHFGETEELLGKYAWYYLNSQGKSQPVGLKKPNDWGLFDMHGNSPYWCLDLSGPYAKAKNKETIEEGDLPIDLTKSRILRGGRFDEMPGNIRSAMRRSLAPNFRSGSTSMRVARTIFTERAV